MPPTIKTKPFSRLTAAAKRVAIANDVLKQIKAEQYIIETGSWLDIAPPDAEEIKAVPGTSRTQSLLLGAPVALAPATCTCCAVGAACASAIRLFNRHEVHNDNIGDWEDAREILESYFPAAQVELIEAAFEQRFDTEDFHDTANEDDLKRARAFGLRFDDDNNRAIAIFKNIVKHNGTFKP